MQANLARALILVGLVLLGLGLLVHALPGLPLGRLPGDIHIERGGLRLYVPITSCLLVSVVLSVLAWLFTRLR